MLIPARSTRLPAIRAAFGAVLAMPFAAPLASARRHAAMIRLEYGRRTP
jgi:hypothetical protein